MADNYYSCAATLAWIFEHYFYSGKHYVWLAEEFFTYRLNNPKSSNPLLIYQDIYQPWKDQDDYDKQISGVRLNLRKGIQIQEKKGVITSTEANRLKDICDKVDITFLYPIVYQVDIDIIARNRRIKSGSALIAGSSEYLVEDLKESEFKILFLDYDSDFDLKKLMQDEINGISTTAPDDAINILEKRC